jgi:3-deoxy-D-manno-octulosonate 8-phosphate phosphatase (KDO 8-P phosphatase)
MTANFLDRLANVRLIALDVDGVLTDNTLICMEDGSLLRTMHARDGYAMAKAVKHGIRLVIITGGNSTGVLSRLQKLGMADVFYNIKDKQPVLEQYCLEHEIPLADTLYMGDDIMDYWVMQAAGLRACPADAVPEIKSIAEYICALPGGKGCVREVLELILKAKGHWFVPDTL